MRYSKTDIVRKIRRLITYFEMQEEVPSQEEMGELWTKIKNGIDEKTQKRRRRHFWISVASAAALIGIVWGGMNLYWNDAVQDISVIASKMNEGVVNTDEIQLIVSPDDVISVKKGATIAYSQDGKLNVDKEKVDNAHSEKDFYDQIIVPKGKYTRLILADGSSLHINAGTKVVYPKQFKRDRREIYVDGEVFIDVKRDESAPFFVKTSQFEIEVLGTAFNVSAYETDVHAEVVLLRGSVKLKDSKKQTMMLSPNQLAAINNGFITDKRNVNAQDYIAWTEGLLMLNGEPLERVFEKLERYYGKTIRYDADVRKLMVRGTLDLNCSFEEIMKRITVVVPIIYENKANEIIVKKNR